MKINIEVEIPDNLKPCTKNCFKNCPFGELDYDYDVWHCNAPIYPKVEDKHKTCSVKEALKKLS